MGKVQRWQLTTQESVPTVKVTKQVEKILPAVHVHVRFIHDCMHTEFRTETHEISKKTDPDPEIENPKPGTFIYTYHDQAIQNNINLYNVMQQITKKGRAKLLELYKANDQISYV